MLQNFMKNLSKTALAYLVRATEEDDLQKKEMLNIYLEVLNYFLATYTTDSLIAEAEANITSFRRQEYTSAVRYSESLCKKALWYDSVFEEARLITFSLKHFMNQSGSQSKLIANLMKV